MSMELVVVRHGRVAHLRQKICYGWTDMPLDADGEQDVKRAGELLKNEQFDIAYCSPLLRTRQTLDAILAANFSKPFPVEYLEGLKEYHFGLWENMEYEQIETQYPREWQRYTSGETEFGAPEGETLGAFIERVSNCVETIRRKHPEGKVLIVTHYGCISVLIPYLLEINGNMSWKFKVDPGAVSRLEVTNDFARLTKLNL